MIARGLVFLLLVSLIGVSCRAEPAAAAPSDSYNYDFWGNEVASPQPYLPVRSIRGEQLGIGAFKLPQDMFVTADRLVYVLDTGNSRIVCLDDKFEVVRVIDGFRNGAKADAFNQPQGMYVTADGRLYVADTENGRIVLLTSQGEFVRQFGAPESETFGASFKYLPRKVAVDSAGRIYVVAQGVFNGIIELDPDGNFARYTGTNRVTFKFIDYIWKRISTKAQKEQMVTFVPVEFYNLDLDEEGFIYAVTTEKGSSKPIQRINPKGENVLPAKGRGSVGDLRINPLGPTVFGDIKVGKYGVYTGIDMKRGHVFTYSEEGDLLYEFGQTGQQEGTFLSPTAIDRLDDRFIVLDRDGGKFTLFAPTAYGTAVNTANRLHAEGKEREAAEWWQRVLKYNANSEIAYSGIGMKYLAEKNNKVAMEYFKLGNNRKYYSKAFMRYRKAYMREHFGSFVGAFALLIAAAFAWRYFRKKRNGRVEADVVE